MLSEDVVTTDDLELNTEEDHYPIDIASKDQWSRCSFLSQLLWLIWLVNKMEPFLLICAIWGKGSIPAVIFCGIIRPSFIRKLILINGLINWGQVKSLRPRSRYQSLHPLQPSDLRQEEAESIVAQSQSREEEWCFSMFHNLHLSRPNHIWLMLKCGKVWMEYS